MTLPYIVGLTGGIASGKSTVAEEFVKLGIPVIDADAISRQVVTPGSEGLVGIVAHFGEDVLSTDGSLDRRALRARIFAHPEERHWLEAWLHPKIEAQMLAACREHSAAPYLILMVPLLLEAGLQHLVDRVLVIDVSEQTQRERTAQRDGVSPEQIAAILAAQLPRDVRLSQADDILSNEGLSLPQLHQAVIRLHTEYLKYAQCHSAHDGKPLH